jgi:peptidoglycan hydrolase-like protein with peptidoglycan-binding domain
LIVRKVVINDNNGTSTAQNFSFIVNQGTTTTFYENEEAPLRGQNTLSVDSGVYTVTETPADGYSTTYENCSEVSIPAGSSSVCIITNNDNAPVVVTSNEPVQGQTGGGNILPGGSNGGNTGGGNNNPGAVLGAATDTGPACTAVVTEYMRIGQANNPAQVMKLQTFLNSQNLGITLVVNGIFDVQTEAAVKAFQLKYADDILLPWVRIGRLSSKNVATGYVYKTTLRWINHLACMNNPLPPVSL